MKIVTSVWESPSFLGADATEDQRLSTPNTEPSLLLASPPAEGLASRDSAIVEWHWGIGLVLSEMQGSATRSQNFQRRPSRRNIENLYSSSAFSRYSTSPCPSRRRRLRPLYAINTSTATVSIVFRVDKVGKGLGFLVAVVIVAVAVVVVIVGRANILHLVDATALGAPLHGALAGHLMWTCQQTTNIAKSKPTYAEPDDVVGVGRDTGAAGVLLVTRGPDEHGVRDGSCTPFRDQLSSPLSSSGSPTQARGIQRPHVEDINTLHLAEDFETLQTSGLLEVGRHAAGGGTGTPKVVDVLNLCTHDKSVPIVSSLSPCISTPN